MKTLLYFLFLFIANYSFCQSLKITGENGLCINSQAKLSIHNNTNDTVYWYYDEEDSLIAIDTALTIYFQAMEDKDIIAISNSDTAHFHLYVYDNGCDCKVFIPNAFTPDGDNFNEYFTPIINCPILSATLYIYDRNGNIVFEEKNIHPSWDGRHKNTGQLSQNGAYIYLLTYKKTSGEMIALNGFVQLFK